MLQSASDLIQLMKEQNCAHWKLYKVYDKSNPLPIASSENYFPGAAEIGLDSSTQKLEQLFRTLGPGTYTIRFNTKNEFNRGVNTVDVKHEMNSLQQPGIGSVGFTGIPEGYVSMDVLNAKLEKLKHDRAIEKLEEEIAELKRGTDEKPWLQNFIGELIKNPEVAKGIGSLISGVASKMTGGVINQPVMTGIHGFEEGKTEAPVMKKEEEQREPQPEHVVKLSDEDYNTLFDQIDAMNQDLFKTFPDWPETFAKFYQKIKENPAIYETIKVYLK